jgi:hypothetical protein
MRDNRHAFPRLFRKCLGSKKNDSFPIFVGSSERVLYQRRLQSRILPPTPGLEPAAAGMVGQSPVM